MTLVSLSFNTIYQVVMLLAQRGLLKEGLGENGHLQTSTMKDIEESSVENLTTIGTTATTDSETHTEVKETRKDVTTNPLQTSAVRWKAGNVNSGDDDGGL